jgi:GntR family transcriptional regulator/MocR family aminotransferase
MARAWSNSGLDLLLDLDGGKGHRRELEGALRAAIREGRLRPGTRLPPSRALARDMGVGRGMVVEAYSQLVAEGYLGSRTGSGTVVVWAPGSNPSLEPLRETDEGPPIKFDWRPGSPDLSSFPRREWLRSVRRVLSTVSSSALDYGDPRGSEALRVSLASYLSRARGVRADPQCIVLCSGYSQALDLIGRTLRDQGARRVAVEDPGLLWHRAILQHAGLETHAVAIDADGIPVSQLTPEDAAVVVTPAHQYPMGVVLAPSRRSSLIDWATGNDTLIIEDDYDGEFRYDRDPVGALQELDPSRVAYVGTTSKTLAPALRLSWIVAPQRLLRRLVTAKVLADRQGAILDQMVLNDLLVTSVFDRHVRRMRAQYRQRRDQLIDGVTSRIPGVHVEGIAAGLHVVLRLPHGAPSEAAIIAAAFARGIAVQGMGFYSQGAATAEQALVLGYGRPRGHTYSSALDELIRLLSDLLVS